MEWMSREVLKSPRRVWGLLTLTSAASAIGLLLNGFVQNHLPDVIKIVCQVTGTLAFVCAILCFLAYSFYGRLR